MITSILAALFVLGVLVLIHEFGHFIVAKLVGIRVEKFSLGFPPRLFGKKIGETDYCVSLIPIGGYVKLSGMIDESFDKNSIKGEPWEFMSKPIYQRFLVIFAGPLMNLLLAVFIFSLNAYILGIGVLSGPTIGKVQPDSYTQEIGFQKGDLLISINDKNVSSWEDVSKSCENQDEVMVTWKRGEKTFSKTTLSTFINSIERTYPSVVGDIIKNYPADSIGIKKGDRIIKVNDNPIKTWSDLTENIHKMPAKEITIEWKRNEKILSAKTTPVKDQTSGKGQIGISPVTEKRSVGLFYSIVTGFNYSIRLTEIMYQSIKLIVTGELSFKDAFAGPIGIAKMAGDSARSGANTLFMFMAFLSLNLGILNLLPIPVLDGGHIVFLVIEAITKKPLPDKAKLIIQQVGMVLLLALMVFVIINDLRRPY